MDYFSCLCLFREGWLENVLSQTCSTWFRQLNRNGYIKTGSNMNQLCMVRDFLRVNGNYIVRPVCDWSDQNRRPCEDLWSRFSDRVSWTHFNSYTGLVYSCVSHFDFSSWYLLFDVCNFPTKGTRSIRKQVTLMLRRFNTSSPWHTLTINIANYSEI